jgi:hypothetical protein
MIHSKRIYTTVVIFLLVCASLPPASPVAGQRQRRPQSQQRPSSPSPTQPASTSVRRKATYLTYAEAQRVVETLAEILPPELKGKSHDEIAAVWPTWIARKDAEIRARLAQGDEDSLVNFLLFGVSFTKQPRITPKQVEQIGRGDTGAAGTALARTLDARMEDLLRAVAAPGANERLVFARQLLVSQRGFQLTTAAGRESAKAHLRAGLARALSEQSGYVRMLETARLQGNPSEEFAERSRLYRTRGLSSDTSLLPNFAIEESLKAIQARGLLTAGSVRRVAIIGPGLDFTDKQEGYDFYPQQTIQPFAVLDTLLRLGLAKPDALQLTTFDLSPRVNNHLERSAQAGRRGQSYTIQLPRESAARWKPEAVRYWESFGDRVGSPVTPIAVPASAGELLTRAVRVRPDIVSRITAVDTNIVLQQPQLAEAEKFDLIIATNIFVYYDIFDQSLAMLNVEHMLRPGGMMLSNNALLELPFFRVRSVGYHTTVYSEREDDGDHIVWYQRVAD